MSDNTSEPKNDPQNIALFKKEGEKYIVDRIEKITSAVYLVTGLLNDREVLKWNVRDLAVTVLSAVNASLTPFNSRDIALNDLPILIHELLSKLRLMHIVHLVSDMNYTLIKDEYEKLIGVLESHIRSEQSYGTLLMKEILNDANEMQVIPKEIEKSQGQQQISNGHQHDQTSKVDQKNKSPETSIEDRRKEILSIIDTKGKITLRDLANRIIICSEKTLQRDLSDMVATGVLNKTGERRWTVYYRA